MHTVIGCISLKFGGQDVRQAFLPEIFFRLYLRLLEEDIRQRVCPIYNHDLINIFGFIFE